MHSQVQATYGKSQDFHANLSQHLHPSDNFMFLASSENSTTGILHKNTSVSTAVKQSIQRTMFRDATLQPSFLQKEVQNLQTSWKVKYKQHRKGSKWEW